MSFCFEALKSTKISSCETVSSQKYENGNRTKVCNFTEHGFFLYLDSYRIDSSLVDK